MREHLCIAVIGRIEDRMRASVSDSHEGVQRCHDLDMRLEVGDAQGACAQNGTAKARSEDTEFAMGIGAHAGESVIAPGYSGRGLGSTDVQQLEAALSDGSDPASRRHGLTIPARWRRNVPSGYSAMPRPRRGWRRCKSVKIP